MEYRSWTQHLANLARAAFWLALLFILLAQVFGGHGIDKQRGAALGKIEEARKSRVIAMMRTAGANPDASRLVSHTRARGRRPRARRSPL